MANSLKVWRSSLVEGDQQRRLSETALYTPKTAKASAHKVFTYEINEFFIPFQPNMWFFPYFCSNFIEDNLENYGGEKLITYYSNDEYESLLRRLRDRIRVPRMMQDFISIIMLGSLLFLAATVFQFFLSSRAGSLSEERKKSFQFIWLTGLIAEIVLFVLVAILREVVKCKIDSELAEANKYSGIISSISWQREGKFLKLKVVKNNLEEGGVSAMGSKLLNGTEFMESSKLEESYYKLT